MTAPTLVGPVLDDIVEHLTIVEMEQHHDESVACTAEGVCPNPAVWALTFPCNHAEPCCQQHRDRLDRLRGLAQVDHGCGAPGDVPVNVEDINWRPL